MMPTLKLSNWNDGSVNLTKHETSNCYIVANEQMNILPATTPEVGEMLCAQAAKEKNEPIENVC